MKVAELETERAETYRQALEKIKLLKDIERQYVWECARDIDKAVNIAQDALKGSKE
jgi:hypothetical protein